MDVCEQIGGDAKECGGIETVATPTDKSLEGNYSPEEPEQLGSVTLNQELDGCTTSLQIRSSARVSKKMRLDSVSMLPVISLVPISASSGISVSVDKKVSTPPANASEPIKEEEKPESKPPTEPKPKRRPSELWTPEDKNTFFEALNEFGKDFEAIQNHFAIKARKRGNPELAKNKDQVRHFYYRTWHKVSKHLKFPEGLKKVTQELYALINYGEMRKKLSCITEKTSMRLNELISKGYTLIRLRGKTIRIRTPMCRALRKLNHLGELQEELKLPARVTVELRPRDGDTWTRVQAAAQNPRARTTLPLQRRLSTLVSYLQHRWRPHHLKHRDRLLTAAEELTTRIAADYCREREPALHLAPPPAASVSMPSVNINEYLTASSLCLSAHEERLAAWAAEAVGNNAFTGRTGSKKSAKRQTKQKEQPPVNVTTVAAEEKAPTLTVAAEPHVMDEHNTMPTSPTQMAINNILSLQQEGSPVSDLHPPLTNDKDVLPQEVAADTDIIESPAAVDSAEAKQDSVQSTIDRIRKGWTLKDAYAVTIGELYLMFGSGGKVQLEYWWEDAAPVSLANTTEEVSSTAEPVANRLALTLQKLLSIAKLNYRKSKVVCPCGHVCGATSKPPPASKSRPAQRVMKSSGAESTEKRSLPVTVGSAGGGAAVPSSAPLDGVFRRPMLSPSQYRIMPKHGSSAVDFKTQLDILKPRYCYRRGRPVRPKNVVVQRMLPLLPKAPNGHAMVTLKVVPQTSQLSGEFMPITTSSCRPVLPKPPQPQQQPKFQPQSHCQNEISSAVSPSSPLRSPSPLPSTDATNVVAQSAPIVVPAPQQPNVAPIAVPAPQQPSVTPDDLSGLLSLDLSTPPATPAPPVTQDTSGAEVPVEEPSCFEGLLPGEDILERVTTRSLPSPTRILKEDENQWLNSEVADFSLSSFLGHLESPLKTPSVGSVVVPGEESRMSSDVEAQLQCLMSENSVDYMAKFADLAAQIASDGSSSNKK